MNTAVWTLWLITFASNGGTPAVSTLATYPTEKDCLISLELIGIQIRKEYSSAASQPSPGLMFCVYGMPIRK